MVGVWLKKCCAGCTCSLWHIPVPNPFLHNSLLWGQAFNILIRMVNTIVSYNISLVEFHMEPTKIAITREKYHLWDHIFQAIPEINQVNCTQQLFNALILQVEAAKPREETPAERAARRRSERQGLAPGCRDAGGGLTQGRKVKVDNYQVP